MSWTRLSWTEDRQRPAAAQEPGSTTPDLDADFNEQLSEDEIRGRAGGQQPGELLVTLNPAVRDMVRLLRCLLSCTAS